MLRVFFFRCVVAGRRGRCRRSPALVLKTKHDLPFMCSGSAAPWAFYCCCAVPLAMNAAISARDRKDSLAKIEAM